MIIICRICNKQENSNPTQSGIFYLPRDWMNHEDKSIDRKSSMANICSIKCRDKLKELNKAGSAIRAGI